jgi:hypothetical protein
MKKLCTALLVLLIVAVVGVKAYSDNSKQAEWENTRSIITVRVPQGVGIDHFGAMYKPSWMDIREYRYQVMELNEMDSAMLYEGQQLQVYVMGGS